MIEGIDFCKNLHKFARQRLVFVRFIAVTTMSSNIKDTSRSSRVQLGVQEWARKFHPDALRNRLRNFRRYVISAATASSAGNQIGVSTMTAKVPHDRDLTTNSTLQQEKFDDSCVNADKGKFSDHERGLDVLLNSTQIPDVVVRTNNVSSHNSANPSNINDSAGKSLQLTVSIDSAPRNKSPITVQEWVDSLPLTPVESSREECEITDKNVVTLGDCDTDNLTLGAEAGCLVEKRATEEVTPPPPPPPTTLVNVTITGCPEPSEVESHCSSVDSLLEARKPDPEEVLLSLGFGGTASSSYLETGRIPKRFLQQSQLKGVDIEEFIRQQQDLIYTFESGYYGYRGLAGPSHSNPSVIVAKILEKLREHERETASTTSYQLDFRKRCFLEKTHTENPVANKFSKVARNVLTKIRCTPSSVLNPDNRRWLDSQGSKSPEIARRLIIGQKSFTFGRDGDLIEASNIINKNQVSSKSDSNQHRVDLHSTNEQLQEHYQYQYQYQCQYRQHEVADSTADNDNVVENCGNLGRRLTDSSTDVSVDSIIVKDGSFRPAGGGVAARSCTLKRLNHIDVDEPSSVDLCTSLSDAEAENSRSNTRSSLSSVCTNRIADFISSEMTCSTTNRHRVSSPKEMSLREELRHSGIPLPDLSTSQGAGPLKKASNVLTRCSSFEESGKENSSEDEAATNTMESRSAGDFPYSQRGDHYADSATESEFASYPHRSLANKAIHRQYEELILLQTVLRSIGWPVTMVSKDQFSTVSPEQRCLVQTQIIREALKAYLYQMTEDEIHSELKNCLSTEVQKVADLLDDRCDASQLAVVVKQMTLLLQHQSQLSAQIKELSVVDKKPTSCHEMCDQVLKRVHDLELLVQQNAQELAQMKNQLLRKEE